MATNGRSSGSISQILAEDVGLAEAVPAELRESATRACIAPVKQLNRGRWSREEAELVREGIGLLVLEGLLIRRVGVDGRYGAELLGDGDLLRPWQQDANASLPRTTGWRVLQPSRVALLDRRVSHQLARYPDLVSGLVGRAIERSRNLAVNMAIVHQSRVDVRLRMVFWHLADRWGRVGPRGVMLPLRLTHSVFAELVAARRPTVTSALSDLARQGLIRPVEGGWLISGDPPGELVELRSVAQGV